MFALAAMTLWSFCACTVVSVKAADQIEVRAEVFPGTFKQFVIQLSTHDSPNPGYVGGASYLWAARCSLERTKATAALAFVQQVIAQEADHEFTVQNLRRPIITSIGYRYPADLLLDSQPGQEPGTMKSLGEVLQQAGFGQLWNVGADTDPALTRPSWC